MKKTHLFLLVLAIVALTAVPVLAGTIVYYTGQGFTNGTLDNIKCGEDIDLGQDKDFVVAPDGAYLKWVLTASGADSATITGPWGTFDMIQAGGGAFHKATNYYEVNNLVNYPVRAEYEGASNNVQLVVSNGCPPQVGEWCSPGYWRQPHHLSSWEATGYSPDDLFYDALGYYPTLSKKGTEDGATTNPTLWEVLQSPQWYGGDAFNAVGDLLSEAHPDINFLGIRVEDSCPLN
jgi:hypothetical protein